MSNSISRRLLACWLGGVVIGLAVIKAQASSALARGGVGATITNTGREVAVLSVFSDATMLASGLTLVRVAAPQTGQVLLRISRAAPPPTPAAEMAGLNGANVDIYSPPGEQNLPQADGSLQGDPVAVVSLPPTAGGGAEATGGAHALNVTVEFN